MKTRSLGKNGPEVSAIALGGMSFAGFYSPCDRDAAFATMDAAHAGGITFVDTAELYGRGVSETLIGDWQKDRGKSFTIATKGGKVVGGKRGEADNSEPALRRALEGSLDRLGVDHVTLYYVHRRDWSIPIETVTETLEG
ncbi:MAG TPA: aldo/keto reductase, partial [Aliiroseovarius sp.]|nr:aldo/keto reductase [Aliiroseovarius sp.]